nr:nucleotide-binding alpha-beta plait domain-containing protein [Tanacetum cinerariifolium]
FWSGPTFKRIAAKWGELLDVDDYDETNSHSKRVCILTKDNSDSVNKNSESMCSGRFKESEMPRTRGSILSIMEDVVKVGQTMGYNMDGCIKDITVIIESQGEFGVNR